MNKIRELRKQYPNLFIGVYRKVKQKKLMGKELMAQLNAHG